MRKRKQSTFGALVSSMLTAFLLVALVIGAIALKAFIDDGNSRQQRSYDESKQLSDKWLEQQKQQIHGK